MSNHENKPRDVKGEIPRERVQNPEVLYEREDLSARGIIGFLFGLIVTVVLMHFIVWGLYRVFAHGEVMAQPRSAAIITPSSTLPTGIDPVQRFPQPTLQPDPPADLNKFRALLEQHLDGYGYIDPKQGTMYIPIGRAIDLTAQQGLPTRQQPVLPPRATFGSGNGTVEGAGGGVEPAKQ